jgi:parallel beta-helix repeat protein
VEPWATWATTETPACNFSQSTTASSATLNWGTVGSAATASILGFEQSSQWSTSGGATLGSTTYTTQGQAALTVVNASETVITSSPMGAPEAVGSQLAIDIALPPFQPNPFYYGWLSATVNIPSRGIYNQYLGQASLTGLPLGTYNTVVLPVPSNVVTALDNPGYTDFTISLTLNVPANTQAFDLDNLRFFPTPCTVPTSGLNITSNTRLCNGIYPIATGTGPSGLTIGASGVTLTCDGTNLTSLSGISNSSNPNSAIGITGKNNVTVTGCTASGFRYGAMVSQASGVTFNNVNFSNNYDSQNDGTVIQGGGINFTNVTSSTIENSNFSFNWNGIELVKSSSITVVGNTANDCLNTGAVLYNTTNSQILANSLEFDIRGVSLPFDPNDWYGAGTGDSAALLLEAASNGNLIAYNTATYGGDGIFIRALLGPCSGHNQIIANDGSFSPNNAFESWCPDNVFDSNTANNSNFGIWVGGSDRAQITNNTVNNNVKDGISLQNGWGRHILIDNNTITNSGRYGVFISAFDCESGACLSPGSGPSSAESQVLVQRNAISSTVQGAFGDMYFGDVLGVQRASNCSTIVDEVGATSAAEFSPVGSCNSSIGRVPPTAVVVPPSAVTAGATVTLDGSKSTPGVPGATLTYKWLVNPAGPVTLASPVPSPLFVGPGAAKQAVNFPHPGMFDIDLTVTDFYVGGQSYSQLAVFPTGKTVGAAANTWTCSGCPGSPSDDTTAGLGGDAVKFVTDNNGLATIVTPASGALAYNASTANHLGFFVKAVDQNNSGIASSPSTPVITLTTNGSGTLVYTPVRTFLDDTAWTYVEVPLTSSSSGSSNWSISNNGGSLNKVDSVQIAINGQGWSGFLFAPVTLWVQGVTFY